MPKKPKKKVKEAYIQLNYSDRASVECCPVCRGNGLVPEGFYNQVSGVWSSTTIEFETCRSCNGKGYVVIKYEDWKEMKE